MPGQREPRHKRAHPARSTGAGTSVWSKRYNSRIGDSDSGPTASADRDVVIHRAMGVLMELNGCDAAEAFDILLDLAGRDPAGVFTIAASMLQRYGM